MAETLEDITLPRGAFERLLAKLSVERIIEVLRARFPDERPDDLTDRLARLDYDRLNAALRESATAASVTEALSGPPAFREQHQRQTARGELN